MFQIIQVHGTWTGTFGSFNLPQLSSGLFWDTSNLYSSGTLSVARIPEPQIGMLALVILLGGVIGGRVRRTR